LERVSTGIEGLDPLIEGGFPKGSLILLAGAPGTGKTVFGFKFLLHGASELNEPSLLVSFGEGRETLLRNMSYHLKCNTEDLRCVEILDFVTVKEAGIDSLMEIILEKVDSMNAERIVIDSFSAMIYAFRERIDVRVFTHIISKLIRQTGCTTILILETPTGSDKLGTGVEEFVADGIIRLKKSIENGRLLRQLEILKMRGVRIRRPRYLFTLEGGFRVFPEFTMKQLNEKIKFLPLKGTDTTYSSGSWDLDEVLRGGWPKGSVNLLEIGSNVNFEAYMSVISMTGLNFIMQGKKVLIYDPLRLSYDYIKRTMAPIVGEEDFNSLVKSYPKGISDLRWLEEESKDAVYAFVSFDALAHRYGENLAFKTILQISRSIKSNDGLLLIGSFLDGPRLDHIKTFSTMSRTHLRIIEMEGAVILYGVKPRTGYYVLGIDASKGIFEPELTPIL